MIVINKKFRRSVHSKIHQDIRNIFIKQRKKLKLTQRDLAENMQLLKQL